MKRYRVGCPGCGSMNPGEIHGVGCKMAHDIVTITEHEAGELVKYEAVLKMVNDYCMELKKVSDAHGKTQEKLKQAFFYGNNEGFFGKPPDDAWDAYVAAGYPEIEL